MLTKQSFLGLALMFGGAVIVSAMIKGQSQQTSAPTEQVIAVTEEVATPVTQPLTADIETETRILEQKQRERESRVAALEKETEALLAAQEKARAEALQKAAQDAMAYDPSQTAIPTPEVQTRPDAVALAKEQEAQAATQKAAQEQAQREREQREREQASAANKNQNQDNQKSNDNETANAKPANANAGTHSVQAGDTLIRLSQRYGVPVSILAEANNMSRNDALQRGRTIKIPSQSEIRALERKAAEREAAEAAERAARQRVEQADARLRQAREEARQRGVSGSFGVQVALAANKENADALASSLRSAGYKVSTTQTNRGVRVVVGPERSREAADALRSKMTNDTRIKANGAWVVEMQ